MSLASIWSGNFYHLRNTLTSSNSFKLLRLGTYGTSQTMLDTGRSNARPLTTKVEARNRKPQSNQSYGVKLELLDGTVIRRTKPKAKKLQLQEFKIIKYCDIQPKIADEKVSGKVVAVLVFDIETTGFCKNRDRIIEVAIQDLRGGKNSTFQTLVNPERYVPNAHIHGISSHMVNKPDIPRWKDLAPILLHFVRSRQIDGGPVLLVAHNGRCFDVPFIVKEFGRCSIEIPPDWLFLDTVPLARQLVKPDGTKLSSWNLQALCEHYGIPLAGTAHRAMSDVNMLSLILQKMTFDLKLTVSSLLDRSFMVSKLTQVSD
ncbi:hypothetical protein AAC387_Pa03g1998 [Persea americana]